MDQVTKVRKRLKLEQWKTIITECRASGMTVTSWCKTHGIAEQTYYRNLKKLREMEIDKLPASLMPLPDEKPVAFRKLEVQTPIPDTQVAVIIHLNGATVEVSEGTSQQTKSYMWLYRSGNDGKHPIILYDYQLSRNGDHAASYLKDFRGYVHSDGYAGYNKLTGVTRVGCWAHLRRKFVEAVPIKKAPDGLPTSAETGRQYCDRLFAIEATLKDLKPEERFRKRLELEKPVLEAFWCWLDSINALKGSALGKAVTYAQNQKPYMENYLLDGRCSLSNNAAENAIRPFTIGRKNWLFADTPKGASSSAAVYSLVETAKANNLNVFAYLEYLPTYMPGSNWRQYPEELDDLMPWSPQVQAQCK